MTAILINVEPKLLSMHTVKPHLHSCPIFCNHGKHYMLLE